MPKFQLAHLGPVKYIFIENIINILSLILRKYENLEAQWKRKITINNVFCQLIDLLHATGYIYICD